MRTRIVLSIAIASIVALAATSTSAAAQSQSWSQEYQGQGRFAVLNQFNGEAVLDRETGLVWQREPFGQPIDIFWIASRTCVDATIGNRRGWRLPTVQELKSLTDGATSNPSLADGHPFVNVDLTHNYWSSTATLGDPNFVWAMSMADATVTRTFACTTLGCGAPKDTPVLWCVRGGAGADAQ